MRKRNYQMSAYLKGEAPITVALAFEHIANVTRNSHLNEDCFELLYRETEYLNRQLSVNKVQAYILSIVLSKGYSTSSIDLCEYAKVSRIFMMSLQPDINYLIERGLMILYSDAGENNWNQSFRPSTKLLDAVRFGTLPF